MQSNLSCRRSTRLDHLTDLEVSRTVKTDRVAVVNERQLSWLHSQRPVRRFTAVTCLWWGPQKLNACCVPLTGPVLHGPPKGLPCDIASGGNPRRRSDPAERV